MHQLVRLTDAIWLLQMAISSPLHTSNNSSVTHSTLLFFASMTWYFRFRDYFQLVARCIVHTCARYSYTMSWAYIIGPKSQWWSGWYSSCLAVWVFSSTDNICFTVMFISLCKLCLIWITWHLTSRENTYF